MCRWITKNDWDVLPHVFLINLVCHGENYFVKNICFRQISDRPTHILFCFCGLLKRKLFFINNDLFTSALQTKNLY